MKRKNTVSETKVAGRDNLKNRWILLLGFMGCLFFTACSTGKMDIENTTASVEDSKKEEVVLKEIQFQDVVFQIPKEYETEITSKEVMQLAKTENSSLTLRYECNQEKNMRWESMLPRRCWKSQESIHRQCLWKAVSLIQRMDIT